MTTQTNYWLQQINNRPYNPEIDLFRMIKYGTYNLLELHELDSVVCPDSEFTEEELHLITRYHWSKNL